MKINIGYLKKINAPKDSIKFYQEKNGYNDFDILEMFKAASNDWRVWCLGNFNVDKVEYILKNDISLDINIQDFFGHTALHWAAYAGNEKAAELLIKNGANKKIKNNEGDFPYYWAKFHKKNHALIELLLIK
jgi:hypothetical protein